MVGLDHGGTHTPEKELPSSRATRYGHILFAFYLVFYGAFVLVNAFAPDAMGATAWGGINWAVLSGLGLIVIAFLFAVLYDVLCRFAVPPESLHAGNKREVDA